MRSCGPSSTAATRRGKQAPGGAGRRGVESRWRAPCPAATRQGTGTRTPHLGQRPVGTVGVVESHYRRRKSTMPRFAVLALLCLALGASFIGASASSASAARPQYNYIWPASERWAFIDHWSNWATL